MVKSNIAGTDQRKITGALAEIAAPWLAASSAARGDRLISKLAAFQERVGPTILAGLEEFSADIPPMFSNAVTATLSASTTVTVFTPARAATFLEWFTAALGVPTDTPSHKVVSLLIERGHLVSHAETEEMILRTNGPKPTGMGIDHCENFFPREYGDHVSVGCVRCDGLRWFERVHAFTCNAHWPANSRVLLRNFNPATIGLQV